MVFPGQDFCHGERIGDSCFEESGAISRRKGEGQGMLYLNTNFTAPSPVIILSTMIFFFQTSLETLYKALRTLRAYSYLVLHVFSFRTMC